ncbi:F0F1 ATP synthase subunit gamma [Acidithiobacillus caldus]|uniref:F0F1 ATP synthase subunit gamma n=1 Tax=Acidithiobacillus caldus TaxID=33059 RepID=UPI001C077976|nr:F0F1 ATP synthase subunit gamma [Acidithiobacillus caldus]MBU2801918.1 F0F1 ATP synthase subunit gamma [Acidithiobacillus caldus]
MAKAKEINAQIKSVKNTRKITRAMEMVAASKMRRAQERMRAARPYAEKIREVLGHLAQAHPEYRHPFLEEREVKRAGFLVVTTDRGLCGALNVNVLRKVVDKMHELHQKGVEANVGVYGSKGIAFMRRHGAHLVAELNGLGDRPNLADMIGPIRAMADAFRRGEVDVVYLVSSRFINTMVQRPALEQLLPAARPEPTEAQKKEQWDYIYEPEARPVLDRLLERYVESVVYQAVIEHLACEQSARMVAMKNASDNAKRMVSDLQLAYNKARQAAITQEIAEISAGAAAV